MVSPQKKRGGKKAGTKNLAKSWQTKSGKASTRYKRMRESVFRRIDTANLECNVAPGANECPRRIEWILINVERMAKSEGRRKPKDRLTIQLPEGCSMAIKELRDALTNLEQADVPGESDVVEAVDNKWDLAVVRDAEGAERRFRRFPESKAQAVTKRTKRLTCAKASKLISSPPAKQAVSVAPPLTPSPTTPRTARKRSSPASPRAKPTSSRQALFR